MKTPALRPWILIVTAGLAFVLGFFPQFFRAERLNREAREARTLLVEQRLEAHVHSLRRRLAGVELYWHRGDTSNVRKELEALFADLRTLLQETSLDATRRARVESLLHLTQPILAEASAGAPGFAERLRQMERALQQLAS